MQFLAAGNQSTLEAVAARIVPEFAELGAAGRARFLEIVDGALADRPPAMRRQLGTFLTVIERAPFARYGRTFRRLPGTRQDAVLRWLQENRIRLLRQGFWGLKALVFMGYYARPEVWPEIGYAPSFDGNARLDARA